MTSLRLHEVLSIGMQNAAVKRERSDESSAKITHENDPLFLLAAKGALDNALTNLVDPPDPSAAWEEQLLRRMDRIVPGMYMYPEEDPNSIRRPHPEVVDAYKAIVESNAERRTRLTTRLAAIEAKLGASMSTELLNHYKRMLE